MLGEVEVGVRFGDLATNWNVVVAHISSPIILGIDFLSKYNCHLNMGRGASLVFGNDGVRIPLVEEFRRDSYRVALVKNVVVPANCEIITAGLVVGSSGSCKRDLGNMGLVEPRPELREKNDILVGRTLVDPGRQIVPVRVANMTGEPLQLYQGTHIATVAPIVEVVSPGQENPEGHNSERVYPDLADLIERSGEFLSPPEKEALHQVVMESVDVFSCKGEPLGRTGEVKHQINTGSALPVRQGPRRLPFHHRREALKEVQDMLEQGVIAPSKSAWASPVVLVRKKDGAYGSVSTIVN